MTHVFGYGSLLNRVSLGKTIGRVPSQSELKPAILRGYKRLWNYKISVIVDNHRLVNGVFLNIKPAPNAMVNGALFRVSEDELAALKRREINYNIADIRNIISYTDKIAPLPAGSIITFTAEDPHLAYKGDKNTFVMQEYINIVETGLQAFGPAFVKNYQQSTAPISFPVVNGLYRVSLTHSVSSTKP